MFERWRTMTKTPSTVARIAKADGTPGTSHAAAGSATADTMEASDT